MKLFSIKWALLLSLLVISPSGFVLAQEASHKPAVLIGNDNSRVNRTFTHKNEREHWIHFNFIVDTSGKVSSPLVLDYSEGTESLTDYLEWIQGLNYRPATLDGKPVASSQFYWLRHTLNVGNDQNKSAGKRFAEQYGEAVALIAKNQLEEGGKAILGLKQNFTSNLTRKAWIAWVSAMLNFRQQDYVSYLRNLSIAGKLAEQFLSSNVTAKLYMNLFEMQMFAHHYLDAFDTLSLMKLSKKTNIDDELLVSLLDRVTTQLTGDSAFNVDMQLTGEKWHYYRAHRAALNLKWQAGTLTGLKLRCSDNIVDYSQQINSQQQSKTIDTTSSDCVLLIQGKQDSQITIQIGN